jgi:hypothetical protein
LKEATMGKVFSIDCKACGKAVAFEPDCVEGLSDWIDREVNDRTDDGFGGEFDDDDGDDEQPSLALVGGERLFYDLAAAVRRGDRAEAELLLDRMAEGWGTAAQELVQQGRYSPAANRTPAEVG